MRLDSAAAIARAVAAGELDPVESVEESLRALEGERLNAVITLVPEGALERARTRPRGPLAGVPLLVKDLFDTAGVRTTYGSKVYEHHVPARTARAVELLERAGAVVVGKANLHEFAWGVTSQNPWYGTVRNPVHPGKVAGGSSGGNAAALAAGMCALGIGTDTGGSIRLPAAACEIVGHKPSLGAVPLDGCFPLVPSFDTAGPMARSVEDCALAFSVLSGRPVPAPRLAGLRVGLLTRAPLVAPGEPSPLDERARPFAERLEALGAHVVETELAVPHGDTWALFYREAAQAHRATYPSRRDEYSPALQEKFDAALEVTEEEARASRRAVDEWRARAAAELDVDLLVAPTLGTPELPADDVDELAIRLEFSSFTRPFNYLGWAAVSLGRFQIAAPDDEPVLAAALAVEEAGGP